MSLKRPSSSNSPVPGQPPQKTANMLSLDQSAFYKQVVDALKTSSHFIINTKLTDILRGRCFYKRRSFYKFFQFCKAQGSKLLMKKLCEHFTFSTPLMNMVKVAPPQLPQPSEVSATTYSSSGSKSAVMSEHNYVYFLLKSIPPEELLKDLQVSVESSQPVQKVSSYSTKSDNNPARDLMSPFNSDFKKTYYSSNYRPPEYRIDTHFLKNIELVSSIMEGFEILPTDHTDPYEITAEQGLIAELRLPSERKELLPKQSKPDIDLFLSPSRDDDSKQLDNQNKFIGFVENKRKLPFPNVTYEEIEDLSGEKIRVAKFDFEKGFFNFSPETDENDVKKKTLLSKLLEKICSIYRQLFVYAMKYGADGSPCFILSDGVALILYQLDIEGTLKILNSRNTTPTDSSSDEDYGLHVPDSLNEEEKWDNFGDLKKVRELIRHRIEIDKQLEVKDTSNSDVIQDSRKLNTVKPFKIKEINSVSFFYTIFSTEHDQIPSHTALAAVIQRMTKVHDPDGQIPNKIIQLTKKTSVESREGNVQSGTEATGNFRVPSSNLGLGNVQGIEPAHGNAQDRLEPLHFEEDNELFRDELKGNINEYGFIGEPLQAGFAYLAQTFLVEKEELLDSFPRLRVHQNVLPEKMVIKIYENYRVDNWAYDALEEGIFDSEEDVYDHIDARVSTEPEVLKTIQQAELESPIRSPQLFAYGHLYFWLREDETKKCGRYGFNGRFMLMSYVEPNQEITIKQVIGSADKELKKKYYDKLSKELQKLHSLKITHNDVTTRNTVIDACGNPWLIDYSNSLFGKNFNGGGSDLYKLDSLFG